MMEEESPPRSARRIDVESPPRSAPRTDAEEYLQKIPMWTRKKNSLEDVRAFLEALGNPDRDLRAIHVAGTNGKGSVCAFLTSALGQAGYRTGTFVSPHLKEVGERFLIDGVMADRACFRKSFDAVYEVSLKLVDAGYCHPSYFEFLFYMAMVMFRDQKVEAAVLETGMGGRLDTTNVIEHPIITVITSIGLDHTQYLGDTIPKIASEKAGIIKHKVPVVYDGGQPLASAVIEEYAKHMESPCYPVLGEAFDLREQAGGIMKDPSAPFSGAVQNGFWGTAPMLDGRRMELYVPFEAGYQAANALLAVRTLELLNGLGMKVTEDQIREGIAAARWPGRMEQAAPGVYLDGAHNPDGIHAFKTAVQEICARRNKRPSLLFAVVSDKAYCAMVEDLCSGMDWTAVGVVRIQSQRGLETEGPAQEFRTHGDWPVTEYSNTETALNDMMENGRDGLLFCAGSLYLIGELKGVLEDR